MINRIALRRRVAELDSDKPEKRLKAVEKLATSSSMSAFEPVLMALSDPCAPIRSSAARALVNLGDIRCIGALVAASLEESDLEVAREMFAAAAAIDPRGARLEFVRNLDHSDALARQAAASALRREFWGDLKPTEQAKVEILQNDWDAAVRRGNVAISALMASLRVGTLHAKRKAAQALADIGSEESCDALRQVARDRSVDDASRQAAMDRLTSLNWKAAQPKKSAKTEVTESTTPTTNSNQTEQPIHNVVRRRGARVRDSVLAASLEASAKPTAAAPREPAVFSAQSLDEFISIVQNDSDMEHRRMAAEALVSFPEDASKAALTVALGDVSWAVRV